MLEVEIRLAAAVELVQSGRDGGKAGVVLLFRAELGGLQVAQAELTTAGGQQGPNQLPVHMGETGVHEKIALQFPRTRSASDGPLVVALADLTSSEVRQAAAGSEKSARITAESSALATISPPSSSKRPPTFP